MHPDQATAAHAGGNGVTVDSRGAKASISPRVSAAKISPATAAGYPGAATYRSFRDLPGITLLSGVVIVVLGAATLMLSLFEVHWNGLLWLFFYSIPANTAISVFPHEPVIVYSGQYFDPVIVAVIALAGNLAAGYVDYHFFTPVLQMKFSAGYRKTRTYRRAIRWFDRAPFWAIVIFAVTPLPFYLVKFLVFSSGYSMSRYMAGIALGRLPRFYLLALIGVAVHVPVEVMVSIFSVIFAAYLLLVARGFWRARSGRRSPGQSEGGILCQRSMQHDR